MTPKERSMHKTVHLLRKHLKGELSEKESELLEAWLAKSEQFREVMSEISDEKMFTSDLTAVESFRWEDMASKLSANGVPIINNSGRRSVFQWWPYIAAAAALLIMVVGVYLYDERMDKPSKTDVPAVAVQQQDIAPGQYRARLTLADGSTIILDNVNTDSLTRQGAAKLANKDGQLVYRPGTDKRTAVVAYNTLTTQKAETYQLLLSDGSKVWLNAGSSIRFPVSFTGKERRVEVTGEAFFEVSHNEAQPFIVTADNMEVHVLGTTFNINAYKDEDAIKTTLVTGKVKLLTHATARERSAVLVPGQQAQVNKESLTIARKVDVDQVVAWRYGLFQFNRDDIKSVMRQIERWYDVQVSYEGQVPDKEFWGKVSRDLNASEMLKVLERYGVHFRIEGKKIVVTQ